MDKYYSTNEDVAFGALTFPEIRQALNRESTKIKSRQTDLGTCNNSSADDKSNTSGVSVYQTADESLRTPDNKKNEVFLEKLAEVINGDEDKPVEVSNDAEKPFEASKGAEKPVEDNNGEKKPVEVNNGREKSLEGSNGAGTPVNVVKEKSAKLYLETSSHGSAGDISQQSQPKNDTRADNSESMCDNLEDCQTTLVDNTILISSSSSGDSVSDEDRYPYDESEIYSDMSVNEDEVITISDSSDENSDHERSLTAPEPNLHIKEERKSSRKSQIPCRYSTKDIERVNLSLQFDAESDKEINANVVQEDDLDSSDSSGNMEGCVLTKEEWEQNEFLRREVENSLQDPNLVVSEIESCNSASSSSDINNFEIMDCFVDLSDENNVLNKSDETVDNVSETNRSDSEVYRFNDTLEEVEMALKQGLDYVMPDAEKSEPIRIDESLLPPKPIIEKPQKSAKSQHKKFAYVQSTIGDYIKRKSPLHDNFKLPQKPVRTIQTPNSKSLSVNNNNNKQFKNIVSPVAVYIKNSPGFHLKQNVPARTTPRLINQPLQTTSEDTTNKENLSFNIPEVVYKPAKKTIVSIEKDVNLPPSIQKMVQEPVITKHDERIQANLNETAVGRKLLENDLTTTSVDSSLLNATTDVSFVTRKQAFIK